MNPSQPTRACVPIHTVTALSMDPIANDHAALSQIFSRSPWSLCPTSKWQLATSDNPESALAQIRNGRIPVLLCGCDQKPDTWKEMLQELSQVSKPPLLIVTSRTADERLWAEALNLGAYDVLAKPFDHSEVARVICHAWIHWQQQHNSRRLKSVSAGQLT